MPKMSVRVTYALDEQTDAHVRQLAKRWQVSQAEVIRRSVRQAIEVELPAPLTPAEVVAQYRSRPLPRSARDAMRWADETRAIRRASDNARDTRAKS